MFACLQVGANVMDSVKASLLCFSCQVTAGRINDVEEGGCLMPLYRNSMVLLPEKGSNSRISTGVVVWLLVSLLAGSIHLMLK